MNGAKQVLDQTLMQKNAFRIYGGVIPGTTKEQALAALEAWMSQR